MAICQNPTCDNEYEYNPNQPLQKYCSRRCNTIMYKRRYRERHKARKLVKVCANPECGGKFEASRANMLYCSTVCQRRVKTLKELDKRRAMPKPPKEPPRPGIAPLRTPAIRKSRQREQEMIERVVAKAQANGTCYSGNMYQMRRQRPRGVKVG